VTATLGRDATPAPSAFEVAQARLMALARTDPEIARLVPDEAVVRSIRTPGLSYREVIARTLAGYADRPALATRAYDLVRDPLSGIARRAYLPTFSKVTYGELARRIEAVAAAWRDHPLHRLDPGEFVVFIAFSGGEMVTLDLACAYARTVAAPLQANLPAEDMAAILADTGAAALVASVENLELAAGYARRCPSIRSLVVIDAELGDDDDRARVERVRAELQADGGRVALATFAELVVFGSARDWTPPPPHPDGPDALAMLMYTSGSTGTPKGAMIHEGMCKHLWTGLPGYRPTVQVACAPLNHFMGRSQVFGTLAQGGTVYFTLKSDMSTLFEDIRLARPTTLMLFPRIAEIVHQHYQSEVQRRVSEGADPADADAAVRREMRGGYLGDRLLSAGVAGSATAPEVQAFLRECFDIFFFDGYSSTEAGTGAVTVGGRVQRDNVADYKLVDVPELGYFTTDRPYPRGELLLKSRVGIKGYFKRPDATAAIFDDEGWLHTGDIMEERGPDEIHWIGRRNNVLKLSQGEYVAVGQLEATFLGAPLVRQIFLYGSAYRSVLLAVVVPDLEIARTRLGRDPDADELRTMVLGDLQAIARSAALKSFEVPRDVLIELEPFSLENGLLSSVRKPLRPKLQARYQDALEAMYREMERKQVEALARLRRDEDAPVVERVAGAFRSTLGLETLDPAASRSYADLGGDSLGAVSLALLLEELFDVPVPVSLVLDPSGTPARLAAYVESRRSGAEPRETPSFASVHGDDALVVRASDLALERVLDGPALELAAHAAAPAAESRTILITGATGFLGRFLCLEWMDWAVRNGGRIVALVRAADADDGRRRLLEAVGEADPQLAARFRGLADQVLEVLPGDLARPRLGLDAAAFARLAAEVDQIVHPGAMVNHLLPYRSLFEPNVLGTAELLRLALSTRLKRFDYVSTFGVPQMHPALADAAEATDVRRAAPELALSEAYASGYTASKWAGEVLLREASERFGLPVSVYRPDLIMAHSRYRGQLNAPDMFTRLVFSVAVTGLAPTSFYEPLPEGGRATPHYDGAPVDFLAAAIQQLGAESYVGHRTFNTISAHLQDGVSLDTIAGWIATAGYQIRRIDDHAEWARRFEAGLRQLPEEERRRSALPILAYLARPHPAAAPAVRNDDFRAALRRLPAGPEVPGLSEAFIHKYLDDLKTLGLLG
jgi:fatty acid CoA ligase FadD9